MQFPAPLVPARFLRREKRFFIHAELADGRPVIAHTNNTGRMRGCLAPGATIWLSPADNPARKLPWTLELVETDASGRRPGKVLVGVNTALANRLAAESITGGKIPALAGFPALRREVSYGTRRSRVDILLEKPGVRVWVEVKNVTLVEDGRALFPDAPTERGRKHLRELTDRVRAGDRAALVFVVQREDATRWAPADAIDPAYGDLLRRATAIGVEVYPLACRVSPREIAGTGILPWDENTRPG